MRRALLSVALVAGGITSAVAVAAVTARSDGTPSSAGAASARRLGGVYAETVSVYQSRELSGSVANAAIQAAHDAGGEGGVLTSGTLGLQRWARGGQTLGTSAPGYRFPISVTGISGDVAGRIMSVRVARALGADQVVVGEQWAALRGIVTGDELDILGWDGGTHAVTVGLVGPPDEIGNPEVLASPALAASWGMSRPSSVAIWGFSSHEAIGGALARRLPAALIRVRHSWDAPDPDGVLNNATIKTLVGDFQYAGDGDPVTIDPAWRDSHLANVSLPLIGAVTCEKDIVPALQGALNDIAAAGLGGPVYKGTGGCFGPREVRPEGSTTGGNLSRHAYAIALDINTDQNPLGSTPRMDCRVVQFFRKWGFAWGGNFLTPDGMHFEWVNERRDQVASSTTFAGRCNGSDAPRVAQSASSVAPLPPAANPLDVLYASDDASG